MISYDVAKSLIQIAQGRSVYQICVFTVHQKMQLFPLARFCSKFAVIFPWWSTFRLNYSSPGHKLNSKLSIKTLVNKLLSIKFSSKGNFLVTNFYHCCDTNQNKITPNTMVACSLLSIFAWCIWISRSNINSVSP